MDIFNNSTTIPKPSLLSEKRSATVAIEEIDIDSLWKIIREQLRLYLTPKVFKTWYKDVYLAKIDSGIAEFACNSAYQQEWITANNTAIIKRILLNATGQNLDILITVDTSKISTTNTQETFLQNDSAQKSSSTGDNYEYFDPSTYSQSNPTIFAAQNTLGGQQASYNMSFLNKNFKLNNFVVGNNNQLAFAVAEAVVDKPGTAYNPVFYYGGTGVGKTHLMQAIGNKLLDQHPGTRVLYCPIEKFLNELVASIRQRSTEKFREKYRQVDLLILDDIQAISNFTKTQEEVFNTFNTLYLSNKQIIMASDRPPKEIQNLIDRLRSRFEGGMVVDIQSPDLETRMAILQQIVEENQASVPQEIITFIAEKIESNVRELEGAILKVISTLRYRKDVELTIDEVARMLLIDIDSKRRRVKPEKIISVVAEIFGIKSRDIKGERRTNAVAEARQVVMYLLRKELELPLEKVAQEVNRKDHTTVLHAYDKIESLIENNEAFAKKVSQCTAFIHND